MQGDGGVGEEELGESGEEEVGRVGRGGVGRGGCHVHFCQHLPEDPQVPPHNTFLDSFLSNLQIFTRSRM